MKDAKRTGELGAKARALFDESVERLDAATLSRLNQGRHRALLEAQKSGPYRQWLRWAPATVAAAAALVAVMVMNGPSPAVTDDALTVTDFEMLLEEDSLDILDDLEFYSWLETADLETTGDVG